MIKTYRCSPNFPVSRDESRIVRGTGGEQSERWTVIGVGRNRDGTIAAFTVRIDPVVAR